MCVGEVIIVDLNTGDIASIRNISISYAAISFTAGTQTPKSHFNITIDAMNTQGSITSSVATSM